MKRLTDTVAALACLTLTGLALAGGTGPTLMTASGTVVKAEKDSLTLQPRGEGRKFGKYLVLKITGTSKLTVLSQRKQDKGKKTVAVQKDIDAKTSNPTSNWP